MTAVPARIGERWQRLLCAAAVPAARASRGVLLAEVTVVFLVTFGTSAIGSAIDLAYALNGYHTGNPFIVAIPGQPALSVSLACLYLLVRITGVTGLVAYLLHCSGEGFRSLGMSLDRRRPDIVVLIAYIVIGLGLLRLGSMLPQPGAGASGAAGALRVPAPYVATVLLRGLESGIIEEVVVLAFVITRLRQAGVHTLGVVAISAVLRASYHLEYGAAVVGPLLFGVGMAAVYVLTRRLIPAIVVHAGYDVYASFHTLSFG